MSRYSNVTEIQTSSDELWSQNLRPPICFEFYFAECYGFVQLFIKPKRRRRLIKQIDFDSLSKAIYACPSVCAYLDIVPTYKI